MATEETKPEVAEEKPKSDVTEEKPKSDVTEEEPKSEVSEEESDEMKEVRGLIQSIKDELTELRSSIADMLVEKPAQSDADETEDTDESDLIDIDELDL